MPRTKMNRQRLENVYAFIVAYKSANDGCAPTIREIGAAIGVQSTSLVTYYLAQLEQLGKIERRNRSRTICIPGAAWHYIDPFEGMRPVGCTREEVLTVMEKSA